MLCPLIVNDCVLHSMDMEGTLPTPEPGEQKKAPVKPDPILATENMKLKVENHRAFSCAPACSSATSFLDGTLNISHTGTNRFVNCPKILVDTGALVPSGIAISDKFFCQHLGGELDKLSP